MTNISGHSMIGSHRMSREELWQRLGADSLVQGELPPAGDAGSPWFVRLMLGIAGWIGAMFLLGFFGAAFSAMLRSPTTSIVLGMLCCAAAYVVFRTARRNDFATQFGLAVSLAGQALIAMGIFEGLRAESASGFVAIALVEATLALAMPNFIHRVFSGSGALLALALAMERTGLQSYAPVAAATAVAAIWLGELRWVGRAAIWRPIGYGAVLALLQIDATSLAHELYGMHAASGFGWIAERGPTLGPIFLGIVLLVAVLRLLDEQQLAPSSRAGVAAIAAVVLLTLVSRVAPGIASAALIVLLGFGRGNRILLGLGIAALLGFLSHYYYELQATLLMKSAVLAASGFALLIARLAIRMSFGDGTGESKEATHG